jgi:hypothetical protein
MGVTFHPRGWKVKEQKETEMRKLKYSEENLFHFDYIHHKSHMDCSGTEQRPPK